MRRVVTVSICSAAFALATVLVSAQAPAGGPGRGGPQAAPQNLKVLPKNWSGQQVRSLMATFNESLGVECSHCHAVNPNAPPPAAGRGPALDYASDGKSEKDVARKMIQMVMTLNNDTKGLGDAAIAEKVTCFTCHAGAVTPARQPAAGWGRGGFSLLAEGPAVPARGAGPAPGGRGGN